MDQKIVDHLFRHQYGKMIAILVRIFGLHQMEMIEDAVQDTFMKVSLSWRNQIPENPEAWLMTAAKHRVIDLIRQAKAQKERAFKINSGAAAYPLNELFLEHEVEDSQLRMIFVACHPYLSKEEQIAFSLKTISGFSLKEIAGALLVKEETIKKRLMRARKKVKLEGVTFEYPPPNEVHSRIAGVMQVIYLIFNEGFHSAKQDQLINQDLCGEALRLCQLLLKKENFRSGSIYALFALLCFHSARIESKIDANQQIVDIEHQDRDRWFIPLINLGVEAYNKGLDYQDWSGYHYEAQIAGEHIKAPSYQETNWNAILNSYKKWYELEPSDSILLSMCTVLIELERLAEAKETLDKISAKSLTQRAYLLHGSYAKYYQKTGDHTKALAALELAIENCSNAFERQYLLNKKWSLKVD